MLGLTDGRRLVRVGLAALVASTAMAASAGAQALPATALIGSSGAPGNPLAVSCPAGCLVTQYLSASGGASYTSPYSGRITQWGGTFGGAGTVALETLRQITPGYFQVVTQSTPQAVGANAQSYQFATSQAVLPGDQIAVVTSGGTSAIYVYDPVAKVGTSTGIVGNVDVAPYALGTLQLNALVARSPSVSAISPASGPTTGGTSVTISGQNFDVATSVTFGGVASTFTIVGFNTIAATAPAMAAGTYDIVVNGSTGSSATSAADQFTYQAATPPAPPAPPAPPKTTSCKVPTLLGHTLPYVRVLLQKGHCKLGSVTKIGTGATTVSNQSPQPGRTLKNNASVNVTLKPRSRA